MAGGAHGAAGRPDHELWDPGLSYAERNSISGVPFVLVTADTIVTEAIPEPGENWFGIAPTKEPEKYCTVKVDKGQITELRDKEADLNQKKEQQWATDRGVRLDNGETIEADLVIAVPNCARCAALRNSERGKDAPSCPKTRSSWTVNLPWMSWSMTQPRCSQ